MNHSATAESIGQDAAIAAKGLHDIVQALSNEHASAPWFFVSTMISNLAGYMSDEEWAAFSRRKEPCGTPGCRCHESKNMLIDSMRIARDMFKEVEAEGGLKNVEVNHYE